MSYDERVLRVWEKASHKDPVERALVLLSLDETVQDQRELARYSIGRRDAKLFRIRKRLFGDRLTAFVKCEKCQEPLEFSLSSSTFESVSPETDVVEDYNVNVGERKVRFRLPTSLDLLAIAEFTDAQSARRYLLEQCVVEIFDKNGSLDVDELDETEINEIELHMINIEPQADIRLQLNCPQCKHQWQAVLDISSFFWEEIKSIAKRIFREVHLLARSYGWSEKEILSMSRTRRNQYLDMLL